MPKSNACVRAELLSSNKLHQSALLKVLKRVRLSLLNTVGELFVAQKRSMLNIAGDLDPPLETLCESLESCMEVVLKYHEHTTHRIKFISCYFPSYFKVKYDIYFLRIFLLGI